MTSGHNNDTADSGESVDVGQILATPKLADALESDRFKQFLDHIPLAIAVSELHPSEKITYCNLEFERLTGRPAASIEGVGWKSLPGVAAPPTDNTRLAEAVLDEEEYLGTFKIDRDGEVIEVQAWSNTIESDDSVPMFRLVALAKVAQRDNPEVDDPGQALRAKDEQLRELQHRVKNNLQMITALIRMEARNIGDDETGARFVRLAGRIHSLALLYDQLSGEGMGDVIDLGAYISKVASAVMEAHAIEGIRLELKVDSWPVSINVAMPTGLVVNELMTNALKYAFVGRDGGTIKVSALVDETGCRVVIADDGIGLPEGGSWPEPGKLGAVIAQSLQQNAKARFDVHSSPGEGVRVEIVFAKAEAAPEPA
ncbi:MAG TPA: histidine kinase dimerization/phosphoacceptor domain -containing protein [Novosphingobium sp.]|nr:histidine kinase dimerization/phosphoacceptor domain -containing protein [Novosphingobium sp.]